MQHSQGILDDHQQLDNLVRDLRVVSHWEGSLFLEVSVRARLARDLQALHARLAGHFAVEERGNYLDEVSQRMPAAGAKLKALQSEHQPILGKIEEILAVCSGPPTTGELDGFGLQQDLVNVLDALHQHERAETALLQEVFRPR